MTVQQGAVVREVVDVSGVAPGSAGKAGQPGPPMLRAERLDYVAEIVRELKVMAVQVGCPTLAGLLDLAYQEARLRRGD